MQILPPSACTASVTSRWRAHFARRGQLAGEGLGPAGAIRRDAAGHQQPRAAARARREIRRELREIARAIFQPGVHRAHDDAVRQAREAQIERGKQAPVFHGRRL